MILVFDCTVLINLIDRCKSKNLIPVIASYGFEIHIVQTVLDEYMNGLSIHPGKVNIQRFNKHLNKNLKVINDGKFALNSAKDFLSLDSGELMSVMYKRNELNGCILCTDDLAVHKTVRRVLGKKCLWTVDLLLLLHQQPLSSISKQDILRYYQEMLNNGFMGILSSALELNKTINIADY